MRLPGACDEPPVSSGATVTVRSAHSNPVAGQLRRGATATGQAAWCGSAWGRPAESRPRVAVPGARPPYGSPSVRPRRHIRDTSLISLAVRVSRAVEGVVDGETGLSGEPTDRPA